MLKTIFIMMFFVFFGSCAHREEVSKSYLNSYPQDRYFIAYSFSEESHIMAKQNARAEISSQVLSSIESELISIEEEKRDREGVENRGKILSKIKVKSSFEYGELIKFDEEFSRNIEGKHYVFAYLDRKEYYGVINAKYKKTLSDFNQETQSAKTSHINKNIQKFIAHYKKAHTLYSNMELLVSQMRTATDAARRYELDYGKMLELKRNAENLRSKFRVNVFIKADDPNSEEFVGVKSGIEKALAALGLIVSGSRCLSSGDPSHILLTLEAEPIITYRRGSFSRICNIALKTELTTCGDNEERFSLGASEIKVMGTNVDKDDKALQDALRKISEGELIGKLGSALSDHIPLDLDVIGRSK